jgi:acyl-CoA thioesterase-2
MSPVDRLVAILDLAPADTDRFRGENLPMGPRLFGGQVVAQALIAATRTAPADRPCHALHAHFLRAGDPDRPIDFAVDRIFDGGSFTTRHVTARQGGRPILLFTASFQREEPGFVHQAPMPVVPPPEALPSDAALAEMVARRGSPALRRYWSRQRPLVLRPADPDAWIDRPAGRAATAVWIRPDGSLPADPAIHRAVLAYLSDMTLLDAGLAAHGRSVFDADLQVASLDHAVWFHRAPVLDDFVLYAQDSPAAGGGRAFVRGALHARDGTLLASVAQEGLMRARTLLPDR